MSALMLVALIIFKLLPGSFEFGHLEVGIFVRHVSVSAPLIVILLGASSQLNSFFWSLLRLPHSDISK